MRIGEEKKRFKTHFVVSDEINVREIFAMIHKDLGYRIIESRSEFPDYILEDKSGRRIRAEVEFEASRFKEHKHPIEECDMIICWHNDWPDCPIEVLELCGFVEEPISFSKEELSEIPEIIKKIEELTKKRKDISDRLKRVIRYIDEFIRRGDHRIETELREKYLAIFCKRRNWQIDIPSAIFLSISLREGVIGIVGRLDPDILGSYSREELQQMIDEAENEGFLVGNWYTKRSLKVDELLAKVKERMWVQIFRSHNLVEIANKSPREIAEMLGSEVLKLVNFMENKRLVRVVNEE